MYMYVYVYMFMYVYVYMEEEKWQAFYVLSSFLHDHH